MQHIHRQVISGVSLEHCKFEGIVDAIPMVCFPGTAYFRGNTYENRSFTLGASNLFTHILVLGSSQSGKTNTISQMAAQLSHHPNSVCVIFDTKGDYKAHWEIHQPNDMVLEAGSGCPVWNIFEEITVNGTDDYNVNILAREIAAALFRGQENSHNPFFYQAATDLLVAVLRCFVYESTISPDEWIPRLNNHSLKTALLASTPENLTRLFKHCGHALRDVQNMAEAYLGTTPNLQAQGILAELRVMTNRCFQGIFGMAPSQTNASFSVTRLMRTMHKGNIFVEYDLQKGETLTPVYSLLFDLMLKETLSPARSNKRNTNVFFILDELKLLPYVTHLEDALNYGRSNHVCVIAGLQSIHQLASTYQNDKDKVILGGFGSLIAMKLNDADSRRYVSELCGHNLVIERTIGKDFLPVEQQRMGCVVEEWELQNLTTGQAIIKLASQTTPFKFKFRRDPFSS